MKENVLITIHNGWSIMSSATNYATEDAAMVKIIPMPHAQPAGLWLIGNHATDLHPFCYDHGFCVTDQYKKCNYFETFPK